MSIPEVGITIPHMGPLASAAFIREFCVQAEACGFGILWAAEHLAVPRSVGSHYTLTRSPSPVTGEDLRASTGANLEMITTLTLAAAVTTRVGIGSAVAVLPLRNALLNARQLASLDLYSGGRLTYGIGVGWLAEEADALGMPWDRRGRRTDEHLRVLRALWEAQDDVVSFSGEFVQFPEIYSDPRPGRHIPVLVGGHSRAALERVARLGDGWIAAMGPDRFATARDELDSVCRAHGRDPAELRLVSTVRQQVTATTDPASVKDLLERFAAAGAHHVQFAFDPSSQQAALDGLHHWRDVVRPALSASVADQPVGR